MYFIIFTKLTLSIKWKRGFDMKKYSEIYEKQGRLEMSFASKMVAIIDPTFPIWDSVVAGSHFGMKAPCWNEKNRVEKAIQKYDEYCCCYNTYLQTDEAQAKIAIFLFKYSLCTINIIKRCRRCSYENFIWRYKISGKNHIQKI